MIDLHAHIIPAVDDGPRNLEASLAMCVAAWRDGITDIAATPHYLNGVSTLTKESLAQSLAMLQRALAERQIPLRIHAGAETHLAHDLVERCKTGSLITYADKGRHILLELPTSHLPGFLDQILFELQVRRIGVVLAHAERYDYFMHDPRVLENIAHKGALLQITCLLNTSEAETVSRREETSST